MVGMGKKYLTPFASSWALLFPLLMLSSIALAAKDEVSLNLTQLIDLTLKNNPALKLQQIKLETAKIETKKIASQYLPSLDVSFDRSNSKNDRFDALLGSRENVAQTSNSLSVTLKETLDLDGQIYRQYSRAKKKALVAQQELNFEKSKTALKVIEIYFDIHKAIKTRDHSQSQARRILASFKQVEAEVKLGQKSRVDLGQLEHEKAKNEVDLLSAENNLENLLRSLALEVFGDTSHSIILEPVASDYVPEYGRGRVPEGNTREMILNREDIKGATLNSEIEKSQANENFYEFFPRLDIVATYGQDYSRRVNDKDPSDRDSSSSIALVATWNLFDGGRDYLQSKLARLEISATDIRYQQTLENALIELEVNLSDLDAQKRLLNANQFLVASASNNYDSISAQYKLGRVSTSDLLLAAQNLKSAEIQMDNNRFNYFTTMARVKHQSGRLADHF
jgi:outer membrane protein